MIELLGGVFDEVIFDKRALVVPEPGGFVACCEDGFEGWVDGSLDCANDDFFEGVPFGVGGDGRRGGGGCRFK